MKHFPPRINKQYTQTSFFFFFLRTYIVPYIYLVCYFFKIMISTWKTCIYTYAAVHCVLYLEQFHSCFSVGVSFNIIVCSTQHKSQFQCDYQ